MEVANLGKYFGIPLIGRALKKVDHKYAIDQVNAKLSLWKAKQLSFVCRVALARAVIDVVPFHHMMKSIVPKECIT